MNKTIEDSDPSSFGTLPKLASTWKTSPKPLGNPQELRVVIIADETQVSSALDRAYALCNSISDEETEVTLLLHRKEIAIFMATAQETIISRKVDVVVYSDVRLHRRFETLIH
jgi:hypothetical protein